MIVKQVPAKKGTGSFGGLADYLLDKRNNMSKVENFNVTNCPFDGLESNLDFIAIQQTLNQRTAADKTLHLVVSFHENEHPSKEVLADIEHQLLKSIGMQDHQRLSVSHINTNNYHFHIAVNKIHPDNYKIIDPAWSKRKLSKKAAELEEKYHLKVDQNHLQEDKQYQQAEPTPVIKTKDIEIHSGVQNFISWVQSEVLDDIKEVLSNDKNTFDDLQKVLAKSNLEIKLKANGVVISDKSRNLHIKSSSIHRGLSKGNLEKRFGTLEFKGFKIKAERTFGPPKTNLWENYQSQSQERRDTKKELFQEAREQNTEDKAFIKSKYEKLVDKTKKDIFLLAASKRAIYKTLYSRRKAEYQELTKEYKTKRDNINKGSNQITYKEYLMEKALEGDTNALAALRKTKVKLTPADNAIVGKEDNKIFISREKFITKQGLVVYKLGADQGKIIDKGSFLKVTVSDSDYAIKEALDIAIGKYGKRLDINGDLAFKLKVLAVSEKYDLDITFKDKTMKEIQKASLEHKRESKKSEQKNTKKGMER